MPLGANTPGWLQIVLDKVATDYVIERVGNDFMMSTLASGSERIEANYRVMVGSGANCECLAVQYRGACRHIGALSALRDARQI
jgi:hypothetical protein